MKPRRDPTEFIATYSALKRCLTTVAAQFYASEGLGSAQVRFLRHIDKNPGISQAELARATATDPALTGRALQTLIDRGWVRRERSQADRRGYVLELGVAGRQTLKRVEKIRARLAAAVVAPLDARDIDDFDRIAKKVLATFASYSEATDSPSASAARR